MQVLLWVKRSKQFDNEWMVSQSLHHFQFAEDLFIATLLFKDEFLTHCLDSIQRACVFLSRKVYLFSESALANHFDLLVVFQCHLIILIILAFWIFLFICVTPLNLFWEHSNQFHIVYQNLWDTFIYKIEPQVHIFIFVFAWNCTDDLVFNFYDSPSGPCRMIILRLKLLGLSSQLAAHLLRFLVSWRARSCILSLLWCNLVGTLNLCN